MPIDPRLILSIQQPQIQQRDPLDNYAKLAGIKGAMGQQELQALQLQQAQRGFEDEDATRAAYAQSGGDSAVLRQLLGQRGAYKQIQALDKFDLEKKEKEAAIAKNSAQGAKAQWEVDKGKLEHGAALLDLAKDQQSLEQVLRVGLLNGTFKPEFVQQVLQQGYSPQLVDGLKAQGLTRAQQLEAQHRVNTEAQTAANSPFTPGPNGPVANTPAQAFQLQKAATGAPKVTVPVNVSTEKKYGEQFAGAIAKADSDMRDTAMKAPDLAQRANQMKEVLASGKVITGTGADARLAVGKALNLAGASDAEVISNTEALSVDMARNTLDSIKASGLGSGSGFSNADRDFLEKAAGGKINLEKQTIDRLSTLAHRAAEQSARRWGERVRQIPQSALEGTGITTDPIQVPGLYKPSASAVPSQSDIDAELRRRGVIR